ncbi:hypothetical protein [Streptomyces sp. NPDC055210]
MGPPDPSETAGSSNPSDEEMLQAVELHLGGNGEASRLIAPGTAELSARPLLDFRIDRRYEKRREGIQGSAPGKKLKHISKRPSYIDLATHHVPVPSGFAPTQPVRLVLQGSVAEVVCAECKGGKQSCGVCGGSGTQTCAESVKCKSCGGGSDACWSCAGTGKRGSRRPSGNAQGKSRTDWCRRCGAHDVACPECVGNGTITCTVCKGTGRRACDACKGSKRFRHEACNCTGFVTTWTAAEISHPVGVDRERDRAPAHLWWPTYRTDGWREVSLKDVTDKLPADLPEPHRERIAPHLPRKEVEVRRLAVLRYLPVARVTVAADPDWVYFAFPDGPGADGGIKVIRRPARPRVVRLGGIAAAAILIAVLVMVLALQMLD